MGEYYCGSCHKECDAHVEDEGIGHYEFWGQKGVDKQLVLVTDCCDDTPYEDPECTVECESAEDILSEAKEEAAVARWEARQEEDW